MPPAETLLWTPLFLPNTPSVTPDSPTALSVSPLPYPVLFLPSVGLINYRGTDWLSCSLFTWCLAQIIRILSISVIRDLTQLTRLKILQTVNNNNKIHIKRLNHWKELSIHNFLSLKIKGKARMERKHHRLRVEGLCMPNNCHVALKGSFSPQQCSGVSRRIPTAWSFCPWCLYSNNNL